MRRIERESLRLRQFRKDAAQANRCSMRIFRLRAGLDTGSPWLESAWTDLRAPIALGWRTRASRGWLQGRVSIHAAATDPCASTQNEVGQMGEARRISGHGRIAVARSGRQSRVTFGTRARKRLCTVVPLAFLALTGCATTRYQTVYCISHDTQLPSEPPKVHGQLTGHADSDIGIIAGSAIRLRAYGQSLRLILEGCRAPSK
jgi:hypothetical protein